MRDDPVFPPIAAAHGVTVGQVILAYDLLVGADIVIPRSATPAHQAENLALFSGPGGSLIAPLNITEIEAIATVQAAGAGKKAYHTDCQERRRRAWRLRSTTSPYTARESPLLTPPPSPLAPPPPAAAVVLMMG